MKVFRSEFFKYLKKGRFFRLMFIVAALGTISYWIFGTLVGIEAIANGDLQDLPTWWAPFVILINVLIAVIVSTLFLGAVAGIIWALNPDWRIKK